MDEPSLVWLLMLFGVMWFELMRARCGIRYGGGRVQDHVDRAIASAYRGLQKKLGHSSSDGLDLQSTGWVGSWYTLLLAIIFLLALHEFQNIVVFDLVGLKLLTMPLMKGVDMEFPTWLRYLSMVAPVVGFLALCLNIFHVYEWTHDRMLQKIDRREDRRNRQGDFLLRNSEVTYNGRRARIVVGAPRPDDRQLKIEYIDPPTQLREFDWVFWDSNSRQIRGLEPVVDETSPWKMTVQEDMALVVIIMPAIFIMMSLFAEIRCIQLFAGTGFPTWKNQTRDEFKVWHESTMKMDMECAATFQFLMVAAFARLCSQFFSLDHLIGEVDQRMVNVDTHRNTLVQFIRSRGQAAPSPDNHIKEKDEVMESLEQSSGHHKFALKFAGLQGIGVYAVVGVLRSMLAIAIAFFCERKNMELVKLLQTLQDKLQPIYIFTTVICIYNWIIVSKLPDLTKKEALGKSATLKFIAARVLLLVGDGQKGFLLFLVHLNHQVKDKLPGWAQLNEYEASLLHVVLLMIFWCPAIVIWNFFFWTEHERNLRRNPERYVPLLDGGS